MFLKEEDYVKICQTNTFVEVLNAHARFSKGFIQLEMDHWGVIRPCADDALCQQQTHPVNEQNDLSAVEYELVPNEPTQKSSAKGGKDEDRGDSKQKKTDLKQEESKVKPDGQRSTRG